MSKNKSTPISGLQKLLRYARVYGLRRALVKAAGRTRRGRAWMLWPARRRGERSVSVIGCGQAAFATLCHFLYGKHGPVFLDAFDVNADQARSLASFYGFQTVAENVSSLLANPRLRTVYIASNHASHTPYAVAALQRGLDVFVEKPLATNWHDLHALETAARAADGRLWAGYNRPFSSAIQRLRKTLTNTHQPLSITCTVHGHVIPANHWYRQPDEGTRICGNAGHWIDLFVHLAAAVWAKLPDEMNVVLTPQKAEEPDDNYRLTVDTPAGDLLILDFTSHYEPPEGVRESIVVKSGDTSATIDDFREMVLRTEQTAETFHYSAKDVGHQLCTLQPWLPAASARNIEEVWRSSRLVLHATDLARSGGSSMRADISCTPLPASFGAA